MRPSPIRLAQKVTWRSRMPQSSYYKDSGMSPALERARKAYLIPNLLTGSTVFALAISIYAFTIHAVNQDEFEDVPIPDAPAPAAGAPHTTMNRSAGSTSAGT